VAAHIARHVGCPMSDSLDVRSLRAEMMVQRRFSDKADCR
jgi:hypothetical protein